MTGRPPSTRAGSIGLPFALVDVFGQGPLTGNPLAVVDEAEQIAESHFPLIAREFNQSETTFVFRSENPAAERRLRSFTADGSEVTGAGHNALGAWWWLAARGDLGLVEGSNQFVQELGGRLLPLTISVREGRLLSVAMRQGQAHSGPELAGSVVARLAEDLAVTPGEIGDRGLLPRVVSTGVAHLLVPVADRKVLERVRPDSPRLRRTLTEVGAQGCYVFALESGDAGATRGSADTATTGAASTAGPEVAAARFFNPTVGIHEDPATGSAAGPLIAWLVASGQLAPDVPHVILQGEAMRRPSRVTGVSDGSEVIISGGAHVLAEGTLKI